MKIFKNNLTRESCRSEFQLSRERTGFHTFLKYLPPHMLDSFGDEIISDYEFDKMKNSEGTVYMIWSVVFASPTEFLAKITGILHQKLDCIDMKSVQSDAVCLNMNLAAEILRFPQPNTNLLEKSLLYSISAIGCDLMSIKNTAQNLFSTSIKILFKDSQTSGLFQNNAMMIISP